MPCQQIPCSFPWVSRFERFLTTALPARLFLEEPTELTFKIQNISLEMVEYHVFVESSESFVYSGCKQRLARILPLATVTLPFMIYPIKTGQCSLPRVAVSLKKTEVVDGKEKVVRGSQAGPALAVNFVDPTELFVWVHPRYVALEE